MINQFGIDQFGHEFVPCFGAIFRDYLCSKLHPLSDPYLEASFLLYFTGGQTTPP